MKNRIRQIILSHSLIQPDKAILIAVSGGSDSVALLHILSSLYPDIERIAVYIDHGLRPLETGAEKKLVRKLSKSCSARFISEAVDVERAQINTKSSIEETARNLRYKTLEEIRHEHNGQCIAVGHTRDDQAEEVLLRLIRGSGSAGLGGMAIQNGYIIRPLLHESKKSLRNYLKENNIPYCEDSSNRDTRFLRNRIRQRLLPNLEQDYNQSMRQTLVQTASILHEENKLLDTIADEAFRASTSEKPNNLTLYLPIFSMEHMAIQRRILEKICWQMAAKPSYKQIASLQNLMQLNNNSEIHLSGGLRAVKEKDEILFFYPTKETGYRGSAILKKTFSPLTIPAPGTYPVDELGYELNLKKLPSTKKPLRQEDTLLLDASLVCFPLTLRSHQKGETFHPLGAPGKKKVSRFLTDQKIPAASKAEHPVLLSQDTIIAVMGLRIDHSFRINYSTREWLQLQWKKQIPA